MSYISLAAYYFFHDDGHIRIYTSSVDDIYRLTIFHWRACFNVKLPPCINMLFAWYLNLLRRRRYFIMACYVLLADIIEALRLLTCHWRSTGPSMHARTRNGFSPLLSEWLPALFRVYYIAILLILFDAIFCCHTPWARIMLWRGSFKCAVHIISPKVLYHEDTAP